MLVPDENVSWNATAIPAAIRIVREEGIDVVVTTSPPPSVHLVGAAVKRATGARWVADLRDSLAAQRPPARRELSPRGEGEDQARSPARARYADAIVAVADAIADEVERSIRAALVTIPNGCDFDDFAGLEYRPADRFRITHTGASSASATRGRS